MTEGIMDMGILQAFGAVFAMILVFVIVYGLLSVTKVLGNRQGLYGLIAFAVAIMTLMSPGVLMLVGFMVPWLFILVFISFSILFLLMIFGLKTEDLKAGYSGELRTWVIIAMVTILLLGLGFAFGQETLEARDPGTGERIPAEHPPQEFIIVNGERIPVDGDVASDDFGQNLLNTLIHPKVAGMLALLLIGVFALLLLTRSNL